VNRCLAEGRERFRAFLSRSEAGARCAELRPTLSAFCDGEASAEGAAALREHLRGCGHCRAAMRTYRAAPGAVAVLAPAPALIPLLLDRARGTLAAVRHRLPGRGSAAAEAATTQAGAGAAAGSAAGMAKALAICAGTVGAVCVTAGVVPPPSGLTSDRAVSAHLERVAAPAAGPVDDAASSERPTGFSPRPTPPPQGPARRQQPSAEPVEPAVATEEEYPAPESEPAPEAVEPAPAAEPAPAPSPPPPVPASAGAESSGSAGSAAGEFGP
jgi:hypothetical protein